MLKTLSRGRISPRSTDNEKLLALNELQDVASSVVRIGPLKTSTADAGPDTVWTSDTIPEGALISVVLQVQGQGAGVQGYFHREALFFRPTGGVLTQTGITASPATIRSDVNITAAITVSGNTVIATVSDSSARAISWSAWIEARVSI